MLLVEDRFTTRHTSSGDGVRHAKRLVDILGGAFGLACVLPLFPLIALAIKLDSPGPVLFRQMRVGRMGGDRCEVFQMIKFRTMVTDAESRSGPVWASRDDPRITRVGRFLRRSRLDEVPQFLNVLKGEMSLIGPRPERPSFYNRLDDEIPFFADRSYGLRPGITGPAQVYNGYDEDLDGVRRKVVYDAAYALSLSSFGGWLRTDFRLVRDTILIMVKGRGR